MTFGPMIGNAINKAANIPLIDAGADAMTTQYIPAPEIFLAGAIVAALMLCIIPFLVKIRKKEGMSALNEKTAEPSKASDEDNISKTE